MESDLIKRNLCSLCALAILAIFAVGSIDSKTSPSSRPAKTQSDPVAEYWKQFDRGSYQGSSHAEIAANLSAREAAARAKVASQTEIRRDEYLATVPHAVTKAWIAGIRTDKIGVDLLVERGITDRQLADLIRWYVGCNTTVVTVYDDAENARKRENMLASYMCGDANDCTQFERFAYPKGKDWTVRSISFTEKTATPEIRKAKPVLPPPSKGSSEPDRFTEKTGTKSTTKRTPVSRCWPFQRVVKFYDMKFNANS